MKITKQELLKSLVDLQAEDEAIWFIADRASEAYLQEALRLLHAVIESNDIKEIEELIAGYRGNDDDNSNQHH